MQLRLTLYLAGAASARSMTAKRRLDELVRSIDAQVDIDVVDVLDDPDRAEHGGVFATPTLVRELPPPGQRVIGDLTDLADVASVLGMQGHVRDPEVDRLGDLFADGGP